MNQQEMEQTEAAHWPLLRQLQTFFEAGNRDFTKRYKRFSHNELKWRFTAISADLDQEVSFMIETVSAIMKEYFDEENVTGEERNRLESLVASYFSAAVFHLSYAFIRRKNNFTSDTVSLSGFRALIRNNFAEMKSVLSGI